MGKSFALEAGLHTDAQGLTGDDAAVLVEGVAGGTHHMLISRGADATEDLKRAAPNGSSGANGSDGPTGNASSDR